MAELFASIWNWLWRKEKSSIAIEGFDRLSARFENRLTVTEDRLDECDRDRAELRSEVTDLKVKSVECDTDRAELRSEVHELGKQLNRHSIELKSAMGISDNPQPPKRTTRKHVPDKTQQDAENE